MIRTVGAICIFLSAAFIGMYFSNCLKEHEKRDYLIVKMLDEIAEMIRWNALTVNEISEKIYNSGSYAELIFTKVLYENIKKDIDFPTAWESAVTQDSKLTDREKSLLYDIGMQLGSADAEGQLSAMGLYKSEAQRLYAEQCEKSKAKCKMYRSLGITVGAMAGIIVI